MITFQKNNLLLLIIALFAISSNCSAQVNSLPITKVDSAMGSMAKPVLILLSTEWCKYCHMQKNQLRRNKDFQSSADKFYYVEFNAESKEAITFHGQTYRFKAAGVSAGIHELAIALSGSESITFPTWVLLDKNFEVLFRYNGVLDTEQFKKLLTSTVLTQLGWWIPKGSFKSGAKIG